jgi:hypothetical protein
MAAKACAGDAEIRVNTAKTWGAGDIGFAVHINISSCE